MSMIADIADYLETLGVGVVGTTLFCGHLPPLPDAAACVYEYGGEQPELGFGIPGILFEHPSLQILCRGERMDYETPRAKAELAYRGLAEVQGVTIGDAYYHMIQPIQTPFLMKRDENERPCIVFNCRVMKGLNA